MSLHRRHGSHDLDRPVLIAALEGWVDAGLGASTALAALLEQVATDPVATFDADLLLDHRSRRPVLHLDHGVNTGMTWPFVELRAVAGQLGRDFLLLVGAEPDYRWKAFTDEVVELAIELGATLVVGLGAYPAAVPHTRQGRLSVSASSEDVASLVGDAVRPSIDVPAGINAALERRCADVGLPAVTLWAQVPHYAANIAYPPASAMLLDGLGRLSGTHLDIASLSEAADATRRRLDALVEKSGEHRSMVRQLEEAVDAETAGRPLAPDAAALPSGDELADEVERFLRGQPPSD